MKDMNFILLYVNNPAASTTFYANLLDKQPVDSTPTFSMFALDSGVMLGLWARDSVQPSATPVGGSELSFGVADKQTVDAHYEIWKKQGMPIAQEPTQMGFGYTFVACDPDGHRLRVVASSRQ